MGCLFRVLFVFEFVDYLFLLFLFGVWLVFSVSFEWMCFIDFVILVFGPACCFVFRDLTCLVGLMFFVFCVLLCFELFRVGVWWFNCFGLWLCWFVGLLRYDVFGQIGRGFDGFGVLTNFFVLGGFL